MPDLRELLEKAIARDIPAVDARGVFVPVETHKPHARDDLAALAPDLAALVLEAEEAMREMLNHEDYDAARAWFARYEEVRER